MTVQVQPVQPVAVRPPPSDVGVPDPAGHMAGVGARFPVTPTAPPPTTVTHSAVGLQSTTSAQSVFPSQSSSLLLKQSSTTATQEGASGATSARSAPTPSVPSPLPSGPSGAASEAGSTGAS